MNDLATITPKVRITPLGLDILDDLTFEEWAALAAHFGNAVRSMEFAIGDWLVYGDRFAVQLPLPGFPADKLRRAEPERYEKALGTSHLDRLTLRNFSYVCRNVRKSCRHDYLSFEHHRALATLDETGQQHWSSIARAEMDAGRHLSVRRLRRSIEAGRVPGQSHLNYRGKIKSVLFYTLLQEAWDAQQSLPRKPWFSLFLHHRSAGAAHPSAFLP